MNLRHASVARTVLVKSLFLLMTWGAAPAMAQEVLTNPDIDLKANGVIYAEASNPVDGSVIVGGDFTLIDGQPRGHIAKIDADGSLDPDWNPGANDTIYCLAVDNAGSVFAGGFFSQIGSENVGYLAKLSGTGGGSVD